MIPPSLQIYNSLTKKKEPFTPLQQGQVSIYTCGPTVYNIAHIGNLRTFLHEDIFVRFFQYLGYETLHIMNLTDVDDKTIKGAYQAQESLAQFTQKYIDLFMADLESLHFLKARHFPKATDFIPQMIEMISILIEKGIAYQSEDGSVYYNISQFKDYGRLSGMKQEDLQEGASHRIQEDEYSKENASDFVLWKAYKKEDHNVYWESPFGKGRPGWHIECSAMSYFYLGRDFDLHCGGIDNLFPHHENEIAQSVATYGGQFAHYFMHIAHLKLRDAKKMSKSLGNFYLLKDLVAQGYSSRTIRYALLTTHYRQELFFSFDLLKQCDLALKRIDDFVSRFHLVENEEISALKDEELLELKKKIIQAMQDDFNLPKAMGFLFSFIRSTNHIFDSLSLEKKQEIFFLFKDLDQIFAFILPFEKLVQKILTLTVSQEALLQEREEAKKNKNFSKADEIRNIFYQQGIELIDTKEGTKCVFKS